jgi:hypothetical protein
LREMGVRFWAAKMAIATAPAQIDSKYRKRTILGSLSQFERSVDKAHEGLTIEINPQSPG